MSGDWLFRGRVIGEVLEAREERLRAAVSRIAEEKLGEAGLAARLAEEHRARVPVLREEAAGVVGHGEAEIETRDPVLLTGRRSGYRTVIAIPFEGDAEFFRVQSSPHATVTPRAAVLKSEIRIEYEQPEEDVEAVGAEYRRCVGAIQEQLVRLSRAAEAFNHGLEGMAARCLRGRRREIEDPRALAELLGLGIREGARVEKPAARPPAVRDRSDREYEEALQAVRNMARVMELDPAPFAEMGEEDLRAHFLVQLNGRFGGQATGETYNFRGKTDLLVRCSGRNVLIGECKFWAGEAGLLDAMDQLLSYLSWRDTRAALLLFYRGTNFSLALERVATSLPGHACFLREEGKDDESTFRYLFGNPQDRAREVRVAVMAFDLRAMGRGRNSMATELPREERMQAVRELLERRGFLSYEELGQELGVSDAYARGLVNGPFKGSGLLIKRRRGSQVVVGLRRQSSKDKK